MVNLKDYVVYELMELSLGSNLIHHIISSYCKQYDMDTIEVINEYLLEIQLNIIKEQNKAINRLTEQCIEHVLNSNKTNI